MQAASPGDTTTPGVATGSLSGLPPAAPGQGAPYSTAKDQRQPSTSTCINHRQEKLLCGRRRDLQRATALLHINRLQPSLPSRWSSVLEHPLLRALQATDPRVSVGSTEAQGAHSEQQCFCFTPSQVSQLLLLVQPGRSIVPHSAIITASPPCCSAMKPSPQLLPGDRASLMSQKQVNTTLQPGNRAGGAGPTTETEPGTALLFLPCPHLGTTTQMPKPAQHCSPGLFWSEVCSPLCSQN